MSLDAYRSTTDGWKSLADGSIRGSTPPASGVIYGMNVADNNPNSPLSVRLSQFGRVPLCRGPFYNALTQDGTTFNTTKLLTRAPEKRAIISFFVDPATITNGSYDSTLTTWAQSVPSDWWIGLCYKHEPNDEFSSSLSVTGWQNANYHVAGLLATLSSATRVVPCPIMSAPKDFGGTAWNDSWMLDFSAMNNSRAIFNWDNYGNPSGVGGLTGLDVPYQDVNKCQDRFYVQLGDHGWLDGPNRWGVTEFNAPRRNFDQAETERAQWITDYVNYALARPVPPRHLCLWEGDGTNWDQNFYTTQMRNVWKAFVSISL